MQQFLKKLITRWPLPAPKKSSIVWLVIGVFCIFGIFSAAHVAKQIQLRDCRLKEEQARTAFQKTFDTKAITAKAYFVHDYTAGHMLLEKASQQVLPLASTSKLMTVRLAFETAPNTMRYTMTPDDLAPPGDTGFVVGQSYSIAELAQAALVASSNDAATALMHALGYTEEMFARVANEEARKSSFLSLSFTNPTGLDTDTGMPSNIGSAADITNLLYTTSKRFPVLTARSTYPSITLGDDERGLITLANTNPLTEDTPLLIGSKTGYTLSAGGNLALLWKSPRGHTFGATVLGSTYDDRFTDMRTLIAASNAFDTSLTQICTP